jgi:hypothetical protein
MRTQWAVSMIAATACAGAMTEVPSSNLCDARHGAHELLVNSASCFLGGMWGDVQGETPPERAGSSQERCMTVVMTVFTAHTHERYLQLRAHEPETIAEVRATLGTLAQAEPAEAHHKDAMLRLFDAVERAEYETMLARRASHRIVRDAERDITRLSASEAAALPELEASTAFDALVRVDAGDLQKEGHVFTLLVTLDRMQIAEQLPVHLKPYVIAEPMHVVFGTPAPDLPHDASKPLAHGGWLAYLTTVATSAGHPLADPSASPIARHEAAVAGILQGVADQLKGDVAGVSSDTALARVTNDMIRALEQSKLRVLL